MTIVVAGENRLAKDSLVSAIKTTTELAVNCMSNLNEAVAEAEGATLLLLDYELAVTGSLEWLRSLLPKQTKIAVYSAPGAPDEAMRWLHQGYDGYLPRTMSAPAIACAVQLMLRGERFVPSIAISAKAVPGVEVRMSDCGLSPRQREILTMVATGASNKHIARTLVVEEVTVKSHVKAIFRKLGVRSRTEAARFVLAPAHTWNAVPGSLPNTSSAAVAVRAAASPYLAR
ncbi:MAG: response regulator transcription factor [Magnetospirillum sp.]|nr:response regulator transcription factor [Magnetospirillum sp.]